MKKLLFLISILTIAVFGRTQAQDTIAVSGSDFKISGTGKVPVYMSTEGLTVSYSPTAIHLKNGSAEYAMSYSRVNSPAHTSVTNLVNKLDSMAQVATANRLNNNWSFDHRSTNDSTQIQANAGILHSVTINTKGATGNVLSLWNGTTLIAVIDTTTGEKTLVYDVGFTSGLRVKMATGTAADITIAYRGK